MDRIRIEKYQSGQETMIHQLIKRVYDEFVAVDYCEEGNRFFYDWIQPSKIAERQRSGRNIWVARVQSDLIGVIETRENKYISLLFVDKTYQGKGIAKKLLDKALKEIIRRVPDTDTVLVHASPFSIPVYEKLGFVATDSMQEENGIKYLPMELKILD
jgi:predicted GNAT family N-acyltransferase